MRILAVLWTLPNSAIGLFVGLLGLLTGGGVQIRRGCLEFYGGLIQWGLQRLSGPGIAAMTLGHTIIGQTQVGLSVARDHEHVHVRQYERWGPFFIPAYLACSLILWIQRRDFYLENPFEIEAYSKADLNCSLDRPSEENEQGNSKK